jgi:hypothetical protein
VDKVARCPHGTCEVKDKVLVINNGDEQLGLWLTVRKAHVLLALQPIMSLPLGQPDKPRRLFRPGTRRCSADDFVFFFLTILVVLGVRFIMACSHGTLNQDLRFAGPCRIEMRAVRECRHGSAAGTEKSSVRRRDQKGYGALGTDSRWADQVTNGPLCE